MAILWVRNCSYNHSIPLLNHMIFKTKLITHHFFLSSAVLPKSSKGLEIHKILHTDQRPKKLPSSNQDTVPIRSIA